MLPAQTTHLADVLATNAGIDAGYRHAPKLVATGEPIELPGTLLKWYGVHYAESPIPESVTRLARAFLKKTPLEAKRGAKLERGDIGDGIEPAGPECSHQSSVIGQRESIVSPSRELLVAEPVVGGVSPCRTERRRPRRATDD